MRLETWDLVGMESFRRENDGRGMCNTGIGADRICELGGIGCNVNHTYVMIRNIQVDMAKWVDAHG